MLSEGCEVECGEACQCCMPALARSCPKRPSMSSVGCLAFDSRRLYLTGCVFVLSLVLQVATIGSAFGGCSLGGTHWGGVGLPSDTSAFSSLVSVVATSAVSPGSRGVSAVSRPVVRAGELSLKFYLRYEGGRFWWTLERPVPSCRGFECGSRSSMQPAITVDFQARTTMTHASLSSFGLRDLFVGRSEGLLPCSLKAERGGIEVVEPPPRRFL